MENRILKFRAWDKKENRWVTDRFGLSLEGQLISYDRKAGNEDELVYRTEDTMKRLLNYDFSNIVISEFTGLKDKNGVEWYVGELITSTKNGATYEIKFGRYSSWGERGDEEFHIGFYLQRIDIDNQEPLGEVAGTYDSNIVGDHCYSVGNIFENPELLKPI